SLCDACREHFAEVRAYLDAYGVAYTVAPTLVRGLDYYTRTAWEFVGPEEGAQSTLSGGGRYDYLVEEIGGPPTPAIGFGAGLERLLLSLDLDEPQPPIDVFVDSDEHADRARVLALLAELRRRGLSAETDYAGRSAKGRATHAERLGARVTLFAGPETVTVRRAGEADRRLGYEEVADALA